MKTVPLRRRVGSAIRRHREATGLSQERFAPLAGMHHTYYSSIERGVKDMRLGTLEKVCQALEVPVSTIMKDAEE